MTEIDQVRYLATHPEEFNPYGLNHVALVGQIVEDQIYIATQAALAASRPKKRKPTKGQGLFKLNHEIAEENKKKKSTS